MITDTASTILSGQVLDASHYLFVYGSPIKVFSVEGQVGGTAGTAYYIQLLPLAAPLTGLTVPLWSRQIIGGQGYSFVYPDGVDTLNMTQQVGNSLNQPVYAAISSTETVYTTVAISASCTVDYEVQYVQPTNVTAQTTIGVQVQTVWSDPNTGTHRLVYFKATNTTGADLYIMLFGYINPLAGAVPSAQWKVPANSAITEFFGNQGIEVLQGSPTDYSQHTGCYLYGSTTTQVYTASGGTSFNITSWSL